VLLIVAALDDPTLVALRVEAEGAGLDTLVEVHDEAEAQRVARLGQEQTLVVGVNARNLETLAVDGGRFGALRGALPAGAITVAESGIRGPADVEALSRLGAQAVLVGEHTATAADPAAAVRHLAEAANAS
jgi:indole-3-glycerol phosphate synthase